MKKLIVATSSIVVLALALMAFDITDKNGKAGYTGAPGESTCSSCHNGGSAAASDILMTAVPAFSNGTGFYADSVYQITLSMYATGFTRYGFDAEFLNASNTQAGTLKVAGSGVKFATLGSRRHAVHSAVMSAASGTAAFTFTWQAPSTGDAKLYAIGNAVNGNNTISGDFVIPTKVFSLTALALPVDTTTDVGIQEVKGEVNAFSLFPNPSNGAISVSYFLNQSMALETAIYTIDGRKVKTLSTEVEPAGAANKSYQTDLPSGMYILRINQNGNQVASRLLTVY
jgi:hypothetical protein